jgi:hypothetical protein
MSGFYEVTAASGCCGGGRQVKAKAPVRASWVASHPAAISTLAGASDATTRCLLRSPYGLATKTPGPPHPSKSPAGTPNLHSDWVVCWIDNAKKGEGWRKNVKVKELSSLSRFSDLGPKVWIQPYQPANVERLIGYRRHTAWTVPSEARKGDLLLVYRSGRPSAITHIMVLLTTAEFDRRHSWGRGFAANLKTVAELPTPLTRAACLERPELRDVSFFKRPTQLGQDVLSHWPAIRVALLTSNRGSGLKSVLAPYRLTTKTGRRLGEDIDRSARVLIALNAPRCSVGGSRRRSRPPQVG